MLDKPSENRSNVTNSKKAVERLTGYFPRSPATDEKIFLAGLTELLASYPAWVIDAAANVRSGLPCRFQFMPKIAEVKDFCDKLLDDDARHRRIVGDKPALPPPPLSDEQIVEALMTRIRRRIKLPAIETDRGRDLLRRAIDRFLDECHGPKYDLALLWLYDQRLISEQQRPKCGQPADYDKRMADAKRLGEVADELMRKTWDDFDREFGG